VAGQEVVQLYVRERAPRLPRPDKELKAFTKVALDPGVSQEVRFTLTGRDFSFYDSRVGSWATTSGVFEILVGASSRDIRLTTEVTLESTSSQVVPLDRTTPLRAWMAHPTGAPLVQPILVAMAANFGGGEEMPVPAPEAEEDAMSVQDFLFDMPISKLTLMGALSQQQLTELIAAANAPVEEPAAGDGKRPG
jgi:beta-glucosidase